jgi:sulfate transport system substrate-binding protein
MTRTKTPEERPRGWTDKLVVLASTAVLIWAAWPWLPLAGRSRPPRTVVFYGFSILREVVNESVAPAFREEWRQHTGEDIEVLTSFAGSGTITNQIILGVPAQVALLSLELDAERLAQEHVIPAGSWKTLPSSGVVNRTPFVILVRPGNPKGIRDFEDLARSGVEVVHPDPLTSGGANWAILAEFGAGFRTGGGAAAGESLLSGIWGNVVAQAASARAARTQFDNGFGDALITYEQEALADRRRGKLKAEVIYPKSTVLSEHTLVVIDKNIPARDKELVGALVRFLWSEKAQRLFVRDGFRSVREEWNAGGSFGEIPDPFTVDDFGGWKRVKKEIVDGIWKDRVLKGHGE